jgi:heptosyltransferase-2
MKSVLIIQTAFVGDAILASALMESLHEALPDLQIDLLVRKGNDGLFKNHPYLNDLLIWDKKTNKYKNLYAILKVIRSKKYDRVINLQRFAASGMLSVLSKSEEVVGFDKNPLSYFYSKKFTHEINSNKSNKIKHEIERNFELIRDIPNVSLKNPKLYPSETDMEKVSLFKTFGNYVCIAPASVWFTKQWPSQKWVELIQLLSEKQIYLLGSKEDISLCESIAGYARHPRLKILAGQLNLLESAALMKDAEMNYVNDSAPMHLCSALNAPVRAIFCSTIPQFGFGPLSDNAKALETKEALDCRPCGLHGHKSCPKGHFRCALSLKAEDVLNSCD